MSTASAVASLPIVTGGGGGPWVVTHSADHLVQTVRTKFDAWLAASPSVDAVFQCRVGVRLTKKASCVSDAIPPLMHKWVDVLERDGFTAQGSAFDIVQQVSVFDVKRPHPAKALHTGGTYTRAVFDLVEHLNAQFTKWLAQNDCDTGTMSIVAHADVTELSDAERRGLARLALCSGFTRDASSTIDDFAFARAPAPLVLAKSEEKAE